MNKKSNKKSRKNQLIGIYKILYSIAMIKENYKLAMDYKITLIELMLKD